MTVQELRDALADIDGDTLVVLPSHNGDEYCSPLGGIDATMVYQAEDTWRGVVGFASLTEEMIAIGYSDEDVIDGVPVVQLWPVS